MLNQSLTQIDAQGRECCQKYLLPFIEELSNVSSLIITLKTQTSNYLGSDGNMVDVIKAVPWGKAREAQANTQHRTAWYWQPTPVQLLQMLCLHTCPSPTASREVQGKDWER